ncbi:MAG: translesion error-prone DNA polymerase V autoproteolytic subunit [Alphaproteobacteria bacterium]|nr:translesion error-prone DNA polymerase V autoproteolytic subunit [Alphaproteobacteria bacterium]
MSGLKISSLEIKSEVELPFAEQGVRAGFPSPAQDFMENSIDLNKELIKHPASTFFARVYGKSMIDSGVDEGDILVIDKSLEPKNGDMAVCYVDGEFTLKYIKVAQNEIWLMSANRDFSPLKITPQNEFMIWGVVTYSIKNQHKRV